MFSAVTEFRRGNWKGQYGRQGVKLLQRVTVSGRYMYSVFRLIQQNLNALLSEYRQSKLLETVLRGLTAWAATRYGQTGICENFYR